MTRSRLVIGSLFIVFGVLLLADQTGALDAGDVLSRWWPLVLVVIGVAKLLTRPRGPVAGMLLIAVGSVLLLWRLEIIDTLGYVWPLGLVALGVWVMVRRPGRGRDGGHLTDDEVTVVLGDRRARAAAGPLAIRDVTCVLGDVDLDLRDARIVGRASMKVVCVLGDVDLEVPPEWAVSVRGPEVLADVKVRTDGGRAADAPALDLEVVAVLGEVTVRATPRVSDATGGAR